MYNVLEDSGEHIDMASQEPGIVAELKDVLRCATIVKECAS